MYKLSVNFQEIRDKMSETNKPVALFEGKHKDLSFMEDLKMKSKEEIQEWARNSDNWICVNKDEEDPGIFTAALNSFLANNLKEYRNGVSHLVLI